MTKPFGVALHRDETSDTAKPAAQAPKPAQAKQWEHRVNPAHKRQLLVREWRPRGMTQYNWKVYAVFSSPRAALEALTHLRYGMEEEAGGE